MEILFKRGFLMNKIIAKNSTARHNYIINSTFEAGIVLTGTEIKSIRNNKVNIKDSYVNIKNGEAFIYGMNISPYEYGNIFNKDPIRTRKLLLHKKEIIRLQSMIKEKSISLIPISLYFNKNKVKILLGLCKGKKTFDKRETIKERDLKREEEKNKKYNYK
jgi:SsrA-binding protein